MSQFEFEIGGVGFRGTCLAPDTSLDVFAVLAPALGQVLEKLNIGDLAEGNTEDAMAQAFGSALSTFGSLRDVAPQFREVYEVCLDGKWLPLKTFTKEAFGGRPVLQISFLIAAVKEEYSDFLHSNGWSMLQDLARVCGLQITSRSTGQSGD